MAVIGSTGRTEKSEEIDIGTVQGPSAASFRASLAASLRRRQAEIGRLTLARVNAIGDPAQAFDPEYESGLGDAVVAALDYGIAGIESPSETPPPVPDQLLIQARAAARNRVPLDVVLRRYSLGYTLLGDFLIEEIERLDVSPGSDLKRVLHCTSALFDRLVAAVSDAHTREVEGRFRSTEHRRVERVRMLLAGDLVDPGELRYELDAWHLAVVASGPGAPRALRELAGALGRTILLVCPDERVAWSWLGGGTPISTRDALHAAENRLSREVSLALGEPGHRFKGWRLSHQQASMAMKVGRRMPQRCVRYGDVALLAAALNDDLLADSLRDLYLLPLEDERDGGAVLRQTLVAYFSTGRSASSAAGLLGVTRQTVSARVRLAETRIGQPIEECAAALETALRLGDVAVGTGGPDNRQI